MDPWMYVILFLVSMIIGCMAALALGHLVSRDGRGKEVNHSYIGPTRLPINTTLIVENRGEGKLRVRLYAEKIQGSGYWSNDPQPWSIYIDDEKAASGTWTYDFRGNAPKQKIAHIEAPGSRVTNALVSMGIFERGTRELVHLPKCNQVNQSTGWICTRAKDHPTNRHWQFIGGEKYDWVDED